MGRTALVTVPDEGAAWTVRDALAAGGVTCEVERVGRETPYFSGTLALQVRIFVDDAQLGEARRLLAGLEGELANDEDELAAQAMSAGRLADEEEAAAAQKAMKLFPPARPKLGWALVLGLLVPLPIVCIYARARWLGLLFMVTFFVGLAQLPQFDDLDYQFGLETWPLGTLQVATKLLDLLLGLAVLVAQRQRTSA